MVFDAPCVVVERQIFDGYQEPYHKEKSDCKQNMGQVNMLWFFALQSSCSNTTYGGCRIRIAARSLQDVVV